MLPSQLRCRTLSKPRKRYFAAPGTGHIGGRPCPSRTPAQTVNLRVPWLLPGPARTRNLNNHARPRLLRQSITHLTFNNNLRQSNTEMSLSVAVYYAYRVHRMLLTNYTDNTPLYSFALLDLYCRHGYCSSLFCNLNSLYY